MNSPCRNCAVSDQCLAFGNEFTGADGVFFKEMRVPNAGTLIPQHSHAYDHTSYLVTGSVEVDGKRYDAPTPIYIPANQKHMFLTLVDDTFVLCVHNVSRTGSVEIAEENDPFKGGA